MRAARIDDSRLLMYHSTTLHFDGRDALRRQLLRFVGGIRRQRKVPVTDKQVVEWFKGTDPAFTKAVLVEMVADGQLAIAMMSLGSRRRANGAHVYEVATEH